MMFICKRLKLNYKKLSEEEKKWLKRIAQKSDLLKNPNPQRGEKVRERQILICGGKTCYEFRGFKNRLCYQAKERYSFYFSFYCDLGFW